MYEIVDQRNYFFFSPFQNMWSELVTVSKQSIKLSRTQCKPTLLHCHGIYEENGLQKWPEKWNSGNRVLRHNNATRHPIVCVCVCVCELLAKNKMTVIPKPVLKPCDISHFPKWKIALNGKTFNNKSLTNKTKQNFRMHLSSFQQCTSWNGTVTEESNTDSKVKGLCYN
jgi:hypothetical protein